MWTQQAKADKGQGVETNQLFFDSESRQVQSDLDSETNAEQARALALQSQMVQVINRLQQRKDPDDKFDHVRNSFGGKGVAAGKHNHVPPEVPPAIFSLPKVCILFKPTLYHPHAHTHTFAFFLRCREYTRSKLWAKTDDQRSCTEHRRSCTTFDGCLLKALDEDSILTNSA